MSAPKPEYVSEEEEEDRKTFRAEYTRMPRYEKPFASPLCVADSLAKMVVLVRIGFLVARGVIRPIASRVFVGVTIQHLVTYPYNHMQDV